MVSWRDEAEIPLRGDRPEDPAAAPTAAVLLVGTELLSGKIRDENGHFLARMLRRRGIRLTEIAVVEDDVEAIASAVERLGRGVDLLFTSGGVGPTHDDLTLAGIARATGRPLRRSPTMEGSLRRHFGDAITDEALSMADIPEDTVLVAERGWPVLRLDAPAPGSARIYILPGVPDLLRAKVEALESLPDELPRAGGWCLLRLTTTMDESALAGPLAAVAREHGDVEIGSYPKWMRGADGGLRAHVQVTFEAPAALASSAEDARRSLRRSIPANTVIDAEDA